MDLSDYKEEKPHFVKRIVWYLVNHTLFRLFATRYLAGVRHVMLRAFGAKIDKKALVYSSCTIFAPWNLVVGRACIGPNTEIYNKSQVVIGDDCVVSQGAYLCTASHDTSSVMLPLVSAPIIIHDKAWVAADAFIGKGVTIGEAAVVGARACVFKNVEPYTIVGGNPAVVIRQRTLTDN